MNLLVAFICTILVASNSWSDGLTQEQIDSCFDDSTQIQYGAELSEVQTNLHDIQALATLPKDECFDGLKPSEATTVLDCLQFPGSDTKEFNLEAADKAITDCIESKFGGDPTKQNLALGYATLMTVQDLVANSAETNAKINGLEGQGLKFSKDFHLDSKAFTAFLSKAKGNTGLQNKFEEVFGVDAKNTLVALARGNSKRALVLGQSVVVPRPGGAPEVMNKEEYDRKLAAKFNFVRDRIEIYLERSQQLSDSYYQAARRIWANLTPFSNPKQTEEEKDLEWQSNNIIQHINAIESEFGVNAKSLRTATLSALTERNRDIEAGLAKSAQITYATIAAPAAIYGSALFIAPALGGGGLAATNAAGILAKAGLIAQSTGAGVVFGGVFSGGLAVGAAHVRAKQYGGNLFCYLGQELLSNELDNLGPVAMALNLVLPGLGAGVAKPFIREGMTETAKAAVYAVAGDLVASPLTIRDFFNSSSSIGAIDDEISRLKTAGRTEEAQELQRQRGIVSYQRAAGLALDIATAGFLSHSGRRIFASGGANPHPTPGSNHAKTPHANSKASPPPFRNAGEYRAKRFQEQFGRALVKGDSIQFQTKAVFGSRGSGATRVKGQFLRFDADGIVVAVDGKKTKFTYDKFSHESLSPQLTPEAQVTQDRMFKAMERIPESGEWIRLKKNDNPNGDGGKIKAGNFQRIEPDGRITMITEPDGKSVTIPAKYYDLEHAEANHVAHELRERVRDPERRDHALKPFGGDEARYWKAVEEVKADPKLAEITWMHGTNSSALALLRHSDYQLRPTGELMRAGIVPFSGELAFGISGVNNKNLSGDSLTGARRIVDYAQGFHFEPTDSAATVRTSIETLSGDGPTPNSIMGQAIRARVPIDIRRAKAWDPAGFEQGKAAMIRDIEAFARDQPQFRDAAQEWIRVANEKPAITIDAKDRAMIQESFPIAFATRTVQPKYQNIMGGDAELLIPGGELGTQIQNVFTTPENIPKLQSWVNENVPNPSQVHVKSMDTLHVLETMQFAEGRNLERQPHRSLTAEVQQQAVRGMQNLQRAEFP